MVTAESDTPTSGKADRDTVFRAALERHRTGRLSEAIDLYQRILATNPAFEPAWINLGVALRAEGRTSAMPCGPQGGSTKPSSATRRPGHSTRKPVHTSITTLWFCATRESLARLCAISIKR